MSTLTLDQWLAADVPVEVHQAGKPPFTVDVDFAGLGISLYEATDAALSAASALADKDAAETARLEAYRRLFGRLIRRFNGQELSGADLARLPEGTCDAIWRALQEALLPGKESSAGSSSGLPDGASGPAPGGTGSSS